MPDTSAFIIKNPLEAHRQTIKALRPHFDQRFGHDAYDTVYIEDFNQKPCMQQDDFNRSAHLPLMAYFFACALGQPLGELSRAFRAEALKPLTGHIAPFTCDTDAILSELRESVDRLLLNPVMAPTLQQA
jgi:hypothetical protein